MKKGLTMDEKILAINGYNKFVGSDINYERIKSRYYRTEGGENYGEVSAKHINDAYDEVTKRVAKILQ